MAKKTIKDLKFDKHNFNAHTPEGMELLDKSISGFGFGRSVVVDKNDNLIAGNGVVETALKQGKTKIIEVETDGTELVVVRRKDVDINTEHGQSPYKLFEGIVVPNGYDDRNNIIYKYTG